ncbi:DNA-binding MarR family transcriptional regulator [Actinoplanes octamycinicus]|uniref:DNA-binding MarR family transcriptional regulator n=1 Tax=Actinoplanes octamycinicus TaxID=135948 RepID=A0A7W7GUM8_9ACTN|nr:MarR family transcriptional regulator [Actinoplanes octamycinicus]MBB4738635.1 DNA-binding MarR family transcriptional regulator [Actinoplanes octamycinicus]GIE57762.1 MarR family transcriptional regulator [Actinoplanes octamycinicus]
MRTPNEDAAVATTFERLYAGLRRITPRSELSLTAASTLARLERSGPHRLCELHGPEGVTQPAMTQLVTRLERDGLASRGSDPADGRAVVVGITDAGRDAVAKRRAGRAEALAEVLNRLPEADRAAIVAALPALDRLNDLLMDTRKD